MELNSEVFELKGVGEEIGKTLSGVGVETVGDLLNYFPRRYDDFSVISPIAKIRPGPVTIAAKIKQITGRYVRRGLHVTEAIASDDTGSVHIIWFNQSYRAKNTKKNTEYFISGKYELSRQRLSIMNPSMELASDFPVNTARIVPRYPERKSLKSAQIRKVLRETLPLIRSSEETLPKWLLKQLKLISRAEAIEAIHFPESGAQLEAARRRLGFEEVFELALASLLNKEEVKRELALKIPFSEKLARQFVESLPFKLTDAQRKVIWKIYLDMQKDEPMNRLVEGDVGSGKTVVAAMAALMAIKEDFQVAFMAPTEILARQHAETIYKLLKPLNLEHQVGLLTGSMKPAQKKAAHERAGRGEIKFMIGTHALIQEKLDMHRLGLIIIDEQHRFGVDQRQKLQAKAGHMPHILSMTATPIPRSLALTLYGELDVSLLNEMPPGRKPVETKIVSPNSRSQLYKKIDSEISKGHQVFVICPIITRSEISRSHSVEQVYEALKNGPFKHRKLAALHGRMNSQEKERIMKSFVAGEINILVSTTVIEVGVDVPNVTIMVIEDAERFGLAQIHQLRGRVGRGGVQGYCYLVTNDSGAPSRRLRALESTTDGFKLAELDLEIRGPGAIYGTFQHGQLDLKIANFGDVKLLQSARESAVEFINKQEDLLQYPRLLERTNELRTITNLN